MAAVQEEKRISKRIRGRYPTIGRFWGSDGTTINVFLHDGHREQFRAHLHKEGQKIGGFGCHNILALLSPDVTLGTSNKQFGQWYPPTGDASVAPDRVAFLAEV
jgi:hypothetical protein